MRTSSGTLQCVSSAIADSISPRISAGTRASVTEHGAASAGVAARTVEMTSKVRTGLRVAGTRPHAPHETRVTVADLLWGYRRPGFHRSDRAVFCVSGCQP